MDDRIHYAIKNKIPVERKTFSVRSKLPVVFYVKEGVRLPELLTGHEENVWAWFGLLHLRVVPTDQMVKQREQTTVPLRLQVVRAEKMHKSYIGATVDQDIKIRFGFGFDSRCWSTVASAVNNFFFT